VSERCCESSAGDVAVAGDLTSVDDEPFVPPACMTPVLLTNGHAPAAPAADLTTRDVDADVVDEEVIVSTADNEELTAEKAAEKMIERRIQVVWF